MGLTLNIAQSQSAQTATAENEEFQSYDIVADREQMNRTLANSPEIDALTSQIDVNNMETILNFGAAAAGEVSQSSDAVLRSMSLSQLDASGDMLVVLGRIMGKFDIDEIHAPPSFLTKLFGGMRKQLDRILLKYQTMGDEVDKVFVQLKQYEAEIKQSNRKLQQLFDANVNYYHELVKYILAGEQAYREVEAYIEQRNADYEASGDQSIMFELQTLRHALQLLEQRTQDLRIAENVAMQSVPMIKMMQFNNMNLVRKINSAFIITLPVFKQALAQAIMLKRQRIQADAMAALDARTNDMLIRNARNTADQAVTGARLAAGSSIQPETLQTTYQTIIQGIDETRRIQDSAARQRKEDQQRLEQIKAEFARKYPGTSSAN